MSLCHIREKNRMAQHEHIIFLIMILRTWWSSWEIMCEKWVDFPYFPFFDKNDM